MEQDGWQNRDAVVVGAGFAGLYALYVLRDQVGLDVEVVERATELGGTWHWNRYPGARCDTESYIYCYSFSKELLDEWVWTTKYPTHDELRRYLHHVADRFDLERSVTFGTEVESARFDEITHRWQLRYSDGRKVAATYLISAVGLLASSPHMPDIPGLDEFQGEVLHTGHWLSDDHDLRGKRVGVIGTGSSGVQIIPELAKVAEKLYVFQRTPQFTVPARHDTFSAAEFAEIQANYEDVWSRVHRSVGGFPWEHNGQSAHDFDDDERERILEELWETGGFRFIFGSFRDVLTDRQANEYVAEFVRRKIRERVQDPRTAEILVPRDHPFGSKRPIIDTNYFETFNLPHVELVDVRHSSIESLTSNGILTQDGHYEIDTLILATGFDAVTGPLLRLNPVGLEGRSLREAWADGPSSFMGLLVADFPNMFTITGPGSTFGNMPVLIQHHVEWIARCISLAREKDAARVEVEVAEQTKWMDKLSRESARFVSSLTDSWFTGANIPGKPRAVYFYLGSYGRYRAQLDELADAGFPGIQFQHPATTAGVVDARLEGSL